MSSPPGYVRDRMIQVGERLNLELAKRGMTASDLHKATGISESQISGIRNGCINFKFGTICKIEEYLATKIT